MEHFGDELVALILCHVSNRDDRRACAQVSSQWLRVEGFTRRHLRILRPDLIPRFIRRFAQLEEVEVKGGIHDEDVGSIARFCPRLRVVSLNLSEQQVAISSPCATANYFLPQLTWPCDPFAEDFSSDRITNRSIQTLAEELPFLEKLDLRWRLHIDAVGLSSLAASCSNLVSLDLSHCRGANNEALKAVGEIGQLKRLALSGCWAIRDSGLVNLSAGRAAKSLEDLFLNNCPHLTDHGVAHLACCPNLRLLSLAECGNGITDESVAALSLHVQFVDINLSFTSVSDVSLIAIAQNGRRLQRIALTGCPWVSDAGVAALSDCPNLEALELGLCVGYLGERFEDLTSSWSKLKNIILDRTLLPWIPQDIKCHLEERGCLIYWF